MNKHPWEDPWICNSSNSLNLNNISMDGLSTLLKMRWTLSFQIIDELLDVSKNPCKPQYSMAAEYPLVLYDCGFDGIKWIYSDGTSSVSPLVLLRISVNSSVLLFQINSHQMPWLLEKKSIYKRQIWTKQKSRDSSMKCHVWNVCHFIFLLVGCYFTSYLIANTSISLWKAVKISTTLL